MLTYAEVLEKEAARHSATMELPEPNSGLLFLRLVRLPKRGRETVVDLFSTGHRFRVRVTRFLAPLRDTLSYDSKDECFCSNRTQPIATEISASYLHPEDSFVRMLKKEYFGGFVNDLSEEKEADHYFMFYTNSFGFVSRAISNPHAKKWPENWLRLINRSYGLELHPPRRLFYQESAVA